MHVNACAVVMEDFTHTAMPSVTFGPCQSCTGDALIARFSVSIEQDDHLEFEHSFAVEVASTIPAGVQAPDGGIIVGINDDGEFMHVRGMGKRTCTVCMHVVE